MSDENPKLSTEERIERLEGAVERLAAICEQLSMALRSHSHDSQGSPVVVNRL
jgi:hypothetical protein